MDRLIMIVAGWLVAAANEISLETRNFKKIDSPVCFVIGPISIVDGFYLAVLELNVLVECAIGPNHQSRILNVGLTGGRVDKVIVPNERSFCPFFACESGD